MQLFIRAEGNPSIGLGHIMRCFALAQYCESKHIALTFLCSQETSDFLNSRKGFVSQVIVLKNQGGESQVIGLIPAKAILVLDGYQFDYAYQRALKDSGIKFAYFDDINSFYQGELGLNSQAIQQPLQHPAQLIINGAQSAFKLRYELNATDSVLCLGNHYLLLREEFHHLKPAPLSERDSLLINFGGADSNNYSTQLLLALHELGFAAPVTLVTGAAFKHLHALNTCLQNDLQSSAMRINHLHDAQEMASVMQQSRLAVCAAGGTQFELLACAVPSILVVVADNQLPATLVAAEQGWCEMCEWQVAVDVKALAQQVIKTWFETPTMLVKFEKAKQQQAKMTFDGAQNIIKALKELAI